MVTVLMMIVTVQWMQSVHTLEYRHGQQDVLL
jgi:hypothetical protein